MTFADTVEICFLECESIGLDIKATSAFLSDVVGTVEINCNLDMEVVCSSLNGEIAINQVSAQTFLMKKTDDRRNGLTRPMQRISSS